MNYIGIFDSGVGGLGIFNAVKKILPHENIIYFADKEFFPYGGKTQEQICKRVEKITDYLVNQNCKLVVVACNTASVSSLYFLRSKFSIPIVGVVPVVKTAAMMSLNKKIGILGTTLTTESAYLKGLVNEFCPKSQGFNVTYRAADELVQIVEIADSYKNSDQILKKCLHRFKEKKVDAIALGCTHFPFLKDKMQKIMGPEIAVLDSNEAVARQVKRVLTNNDDLEDAQKAKYRFLTNKNLDDFSRQITNLINIENKEVEKIVL